MASGQLIQHFDTWRLGYAGASVTVYVGDTTQKAQIFSDVGLTVPVSNPVTLASKVDGANNSYGKFPVPLYTGQPYRLDVDGVDGGGVHFPPILDLVGQDLSDALSKVRLGLVYRRLQDRFADFIVAEDYGELGTSAETNTATLTNAIGKAAALGGGAVLLPGREIPFNQIDLPEGVRLRGLGRRATVLVSQFQGTAVRLSGNKAGLELLTLDGVNTQLNSIGVLSVGNDQVWMFDAEIRRFETGMHFKGGENCLFFGLYVSGCSINAKLHGDLNAGGGGGGKVWRNNSWQHGLCANSASIGVELSYEDAEVLNNHFDDVSFQSNQTALKVNGARYTDLEHCEWSSNTVNVDVRDDDTATLGLRNDVQNLHIRESWIKAGRALFKDTCLNVVIEKTDIQAVEFALTQPRNPIQLVDCIEDASVTITGTGTALIRQNSTFVGATTGVTTDATATAAWRITLDPGEVVTFTARATASGRNNADRAGYVIHGSAYRPGSTLAYITQTGNFALGQVVTGGTSGATGRIIADADGGATGTLTLRDIVGEFINGETLTDPLGGAAIANGTLAHQNVAIGNQVATSTYETDAAFACVAAVSGSDLLVNVTGAAAKTVDWNVHVDLIRYG